MRDSSKVKGTILALTLMFVPLAVMLSVMVARAITFGSGYSMKTQHQERVFYLAESGLNIAYRLLQAENFSVDTHQANGSSRSNSDPELLRDITGELDLDRASDGWYVWRWKPGDPVEDSYTRSGLEEEFRFQVTRPTARSFRIECRARVGSQLETQVLDGEISSMLDFVVFDNGDFADLTRSHNDLLVGDIHANGNVYLRPYQTDGLPGAFAATNNPTIRLEVGNLSAGGAIYRHVDPWGNEDDGGTVWIKNSNTGQAAMSEGRQQGKIGKGNAFDSFHPHWNAPLTDSRGALAKWGSAVADRSLGAQTKSAPVAETFYPGGYYDNNADIKIDENTDESWVKSKSFFNDSEDRLVNVKEIDLAAMASAGVWPDNGLLYSEEPIRIVNGHELADDLTIVSASTVYIKGDFNKEFPTQEAYDSGLPADKNAAILTPDRIYQLTSSYEDTQSASDRTILGLIFGEYEATDPPLYSDDPPNTLEVNGAFVDGTPTTDARAWIDDVDNHYYIEEDGLNILGIPFPEKVKQIPSPLGTVKVAYAQSEPLLEDLQKVRLVGKGAIGHLRVAKMAKYDNSDASKTVMPWMVHTSYIPSDQEYKLDDGTMVPGRVFRYDESFSSGGAMSSVPFQPKVGRRVRWMRM